MGSREEFEKWKQKHSMNPQIAIRDSNGDYQYIETRRDWFVWQAALAAAPTPPAPEVDAIYQVEVYGDTGQLWADVDKADMEWEANIQHKEVRTLYTHPANDGLRKAAEEIMNYWERDGGSLDAVLENLRAELNKDKSC